MEALSVNGHDVAPETLGEFRSASDLLGDPGGLAEAMDERGYLFFPGLLAPELVLHARHEILTKYAIVGEIDDRGIGADGSVMDAVAGDAPALEGINMRAFSLSVRTGRHYRDVVEAPALMEMYADLLEGEPRCYDFRWPRFVRPGEGCGFHCDGPYMNRGADALYSSWIPLGGVARHEGALMLLADSHTNEDLAKGYLSMDADEDRLVWLDDDPETIRDRYGSRWLSADFEPGDVLCFTMATLHGALDNRTTRRRCRLSSDSRYQRADQPGDDRWNGMDAAGRIKGHGGDRVFYPGLGRWGNADFQDEWKYVDELGRISGGFRAP